MNTLTKLRHAMMIVVFVVALSAFTLAAPANQPSDTKRSHNVVIIHVDDLGWRDLSCMGSPVYETPHTDKLAASGTLLTSAYAAAPICTPARASLLTGAQAPRHGVYTVVKNRGKKQHWKVVPEKNNQFLPKDIPTLGTALSEAGVANGTMGKWHVAVGTPSHGFSEGKWGGYLGLPINYFAPFKLGFLPKDAPDGAYLPTYIREAGVDFIDRHRDEPFFLYFSTYLPHDEIKNDGEGSTLDAPADVIAKYERKIAELRARGTDLQGHDNAIYAAMIEETDRSVGVIVDKLEELDLREKTLVIFISDNGGHGSYTSNAPLRGAKGHLYEGGIRVPMIASLPGRIAAGAVSDEPVSGIDLLPTVCAFMGVEPTDPALIDGEDLSPLLFEGKSLGGEGGRNLFWTFPCYGSQSDPRSVLRRGDWKLHHRYEDGGYELYNLKQDIGETNDLAAERPDVLAEMRQELNACYERFGGTASLPANPAYDPESTAPNLVPPAADEPVTTQAAYEAMGLR